MYNPDNYLVLGDLFRLPANCFLIFCNDLAVLIFVTLMADIQKSNWKSALGPWGGYSQLFNPSHLYCFILMLYACLKVYFHGNNLLFFLFTIFEFLCYCCAAVGQNWLLSSLFILWPKCKVVVKLNMKSKQYHEFIFVLIPAFSK